MLSLCCFCFKIRRPPRRTRTDTLFPDTCLLRLRACAPCDAHGRCLSAGFRHDERAGPVPQHPGRDPGQEAVRAAGHRGLVDPARAVPTARAPDRLEDRPPAARCRTHRRSEEHTSELQSLMRISYAVFCLKTKKKTIQL